MANRVSAELTKTDYEAIRDGLVQIRTLLPFLQEIDPLERRRGQRMGQASMGYVRECLDTAHTNPEVLARNFDVEAFQSAHNLYAMLANVDRDLESLFQKVRDTLLMTGKDLMEQSNDVYKRVKEEARRNNSYRPMKERLGEFYEKTRQSPGNGDSNGTT
jgi:hypothetical protein